MSYLSYFKASNVWYSLKLYLALIWLLFSHLLPITCTAYLLYLPWPQWESNAHLKLALNQRLFMRSPCSYCNRWPLLGDFGQFLE